VVSLSSLSTFLEAGVVLCNTAAAGAGDFGEVIPPERKVVLSCLATNRGEKEKRPQIQTPATVTTPAPALLLPAHRTTK
jgi:hypothetical protein